jgi:hypothetical protein
MAAVSNDFTNFIKGAWTQVAQFVRLHRVPFIVAATVLGVLVLSLIAAAASGAFAPPNEGKVRVVSISKPDGTADAANVGMLGTYSVLTNKAGLAKSTETLLAAWTQDSPLSAGQPYVVSVSRVTADGTIVRRFQRLSGGVYYTALASSSSTWNFPADGTGSWTVSTTNEARVVVFA